MTASLGGKAGSMPALQRLYNNHVNTYGKICDWHDLRLIPLAFDTLGRMHPDSAKNCTMLSSSIV